MSDKTIRQIEAQYRSEYKTLKRRLEQMGLRHVARNTLREHFDDLQNITVEITAIDAMAMMYAAKEAKVHPDIIIQCILRDRIPGGYYLQAAKHMFTDMRATVDVVEELSAQGISYKSVSPARLQEMVCQRKEDISRDGKGH